MSVSPIKIDELLTVSPQINPEDVASVSSLGFRMIINNRPDHEVAGQPTNSAIEAEAKKVGIPYFFLPVVGGAITEEQVAKMDSILQQAKEGGVLPVFAFCRSGARCTMLYKMVLAGRDA